MIYTKKIKRHRISKPVAIQDFCTDLLQKYAKSPHQESLKYLWENWDMIVGEDLLPLAKPLGNKGKILIIGADNPMDLQEIRMYYTEILERANEFLKAFDLVDYFEKIEFSLMKGKNSLTEKEHIPEHFNNILPPRPKKYGGKIDFKGNKSLEKCYEAFCNRLEYEKKIK